MNSTNVGDFKSIRMMINNDTLIKTLDKQDLCACLKRSKLNLDEFSYVFQQIKSKYEITDRFDIIRNLSIDSGEINNIEISKILELLKIFGQCIEWDAFDSIVELIESEFSKIQQRNNKYIEILETTQSLDSIYDVFNKIANKNDVETMSIAIKRKLHKPKKSRQDIFSYSLKNSNFNLIRYMIEFGINYPQHLLTINSDKNTKITKYFFKIPYFDVNAKHEIFRKTTLITASQDGHHEVVKLLLTVPGIDVNAKDSDNNTALHLASYYGHHEVVKLLLAVPGIDVNAKNDYKDTALIWASKEGHHEVVKLLLTVPGIDVNAKNNNKDTALIRASKKGHHEVVKLLLAVPGIDVNAKDNKNKTALIWASICSNYEVVKLLLTVPGIDVNVKNN